jgi:hypothetical protein
MRHMLFLVSLQFIGGRKAAGAQPAVELLHRLRQMMQLYVHPQRIAQRERLVAYAALERRPVLVVLLLQHGIGDKLLLIGGELDRSVVAERLRVSRRTSLADFHVNIQLVDVQIALFGERLIAPVAYVGFLTRMQSHMTEQERFTLKTNAIIKLFFRCYLSTDIERSIA